ncbi:GNAT family N-acetyltransferase [Zavarzinia compransoris]|uniref:GNAT family N-acetyltransferase n=1 Tax=Zavarzinia marina TaxID=2911065 RepID=UPI001F3E5D07|nr:GNAT family N-acetyltransferase [Zavarzinia marina]MCF4166613.1 GNAT family N-acetyltransferase [Zavarzinia marina]
MVERNGKQEDGDGLRIEIAQGAHLVPASAWDACAGGDNPFVCHAFFSCLEDSGCASRETGWAPHHLVLRDGAGDVMGIMPLYLKSHSQGEYVFDQGWAQAYERAGGRYYPKLQASVPFTPVTGPRFLVAPGAGRDVVERLLARTAIDLARSNGLSSLHVTFATEGEWRRLADEDFLQRTDRQFHWDNADYADFEAFLTALSSRKRKQIRKERRQALADGAIEIHALTGDALAPEHWHAFERCYLSTGAMKWGRPYLNRDFFLRLHETMRDRVLLVMARRNGRWIAGALNLIGRDTLYGRNWGCIEDHPCLHFEVCYYQAIEFAIARGLKRVEAGAQGEHKLARGYVPRATHSLHWIADPGFRRAVADYLERERAAVEDESDWLSEHAPYRHEEGR